MKASKKKMETVTELASVQLIEGASQREIIEQIHQILLSDGHKQKAAAKMSVQIARNVKDRLEGDRRLYKHEQPSTVDLDDEYEVILYIRDLFNLRDFLSDEGMDQELLKFLGILRKHGWGEKQRHAFVTKAGKHTNFEYATNSSGKRVLPRQIPERGDRQEYLRNRFRLSK
jgi:hypothetical protein